LKEHKVKIAIITDDGKTISRHFARAQFYLVVTIDEGIIIDREMREKIGHNHFSTAGQEEHSHEHHGADEASHGKHSQMAQAIADCQAVICGGMGMGAYESMRRLNIQPIVTDLINVNEIVIAYISGKLIDHTELLH
jgi:predicted Fe-Mo cluster-binding NifX family protein